MVAPKLLLVLTLLLCAAISRAADNTNAPAARDSRKPLADVEVSPEWIEAALQHGRPQDLVNLGFDYVTRDWDAEAQAKGVSLFAIAAAFQNASAEHNLAMAFGKGIGVARDERKAVDWLTAAAMDGFAVAQRDLGRLLCGKPADAPDHAKGFRWLSRSADHGDPEAEYFLGTMYEERIDNKADRIESFKWLQLAVDGGYKDAAGHRDKVASLMSSSEKQEALRRAHDFLPDSKLVPFEDEANPVTCALGNNFQIPVRVFDKTIFMVVDTGAPTTVLDSGLRSRLGKPLAMLPGVRTSASADTTSLDLFDCPAVFIGEGRFAPLLAITEGFQKTRQITGDPISGFLGLSCLKYHVVCFDSDNGTFTIGGSVPQSVKDAASAFQLKLKGHGYGIDAYLNGRGPIFLSIDSGSYDSISLNEWDWDKAFAGESTPSRTGQYADAAGLVAKIRYSRLRTLTIGDDTYKDIIAVAPKNLNSYSLLGNAFLARHRCYLDYPNKMLYLLPGRHFNDPDAKDISGMVLIKMGGATVVDSVDTDSPAFKAGIETGDVILSIDEQPADSLQLMDIYKLLNASPGREIKMQVKRDAQTKEIHFRLKRLI